MAGKKKFQLDQEAAFLSIIGRKEESEQQNSFEESSEASIQEKEKSSEKKGRPKTVGETKQRISLAMLPSLYENLRKISFVERRSMSEIFSECIERYVHENSDKLAEFEKIKNGR